MTQETIKALAEQLNIEPEYLLKQLKTVGVDKTSIDDKISMEEKTRFHASIEDNQNIATSRVALTKRKEATLKGNAQVTKKTEKKSTSKAEKANVTKQTNTLVVGAGPAGLAVAACLKKKNIDYLIVEASSYVGNTWRNHYKRLHFHTAKRYSNLPYKKFDEEFNRFPSRQQVVRYLENYAENFSIEPIFNEKITKIAQDGDSNYFANGTKHNYSAKNLVIATGFNKNPKSPKWQGIETFTGKILHSSEYLQGLEFEGKKVLVVGFGNSAVEIALDLYEYGALAALSVRSPVNVLPREVFGMPTLAMGIWQRHLPVNFVDKLNRLTSRLLIGDLRPYGLRPLDAGPMENLKRKSRVPMLDIGTIGRIKSGDIKVYPNIKSISANQIKFTDGVISEFDAIVLATGYSQDVDEFLQFEDDNLQKQLLDDKGCPRTSGHKSAAKGLYFCGFYVSPAGMFREMAQEAKRIADFIAK